MENISFGKIEYQDYRILNMFVPELEVVIYAINVKNISKNISKEPEEFQNKIPRERYRKMLKYHNSPDKMLLIGNSLVLTGNMRWRFVFRADRTLFQICLDNLKKVS
jgi:hypothetical protein